MTTLKSALKATIDDYHDMAFSGGGRTVEDILHFYAPESELVATDGRVYAGTQREPEATEREAENGDVGAYWAPLIWRRGLNWKGIARSHSLRVEESFAYEVSEYHYRYGISDLAPDEQGESIERGRYLAIWVNTDETWQILAQSFSSQDAAFISKLRALKDREEDAHHADTSAETSSPD